MGDYFCYLDVEDDDVLIHNEFSSPSNPSSPVNALSTSSTPSSPSSPVNALSTSSTPSSCNEIVIEYYEDFDCPTDEIIVKSSSCTVVRRRDGGPPPSPPSPPPLATAQDEVIVIPANADSLQQAIQQVTANGVTVVDMRSLGGGDSERSSPGSGEQQVAVVQSGEGQHYIAVTGDGGGVGYHVQYVESQELYSQPQQGPSQMAYPVYTVGEGASNYNGTGPGGQWYASSGSSGGQQASHHYLISGAPAEEAVGPMQRSSPQTVAAEASYLGAQGGQGSPEEGREGAGAAHAARSSPATLQWLLENYETAEGVSLPRSTLYSHYLRHCGQRDLEPVNAASFGKLIRSVFMGLRTRRLGTRGNSKYHYYGIRVKPGSSLSGAACQSEGGSNTAKGRCGSGGAAGGRAHARQDQLEQGTNSHMHQHHQYLGDGNGAIPDFPEIQFNEALPGDCTLEDVDTLKSIYREHCEAFLDAVLSLELSTVESLWREFWRQNNNNDSDECEEEKYLSKTKLYQLCGLVEVQRWVRAVDVAFYQRLVQVLLPDVLRPIPSPLTQAIRNFAKDYITSLMRKAIDLSEANPQLQRGGVAGAGAGAGLESWLVGAMGGCPQGMIRSKAGPAAALAQSLRRYTSLNHLAQAARAVLHNSQQIQQMLADLNRVDFHNVQEQASWVCQCPSGVVGELEADFKRTLQRQASLEQWAAWLEAAVRRALRPHEDSPHYAHHARQFLLKWSFYSSMVIRDLTLRSAASFGSFHLIRLLYDEYMFYLIEHRVAAHQGSAPIQVMAEKDLMNGSLEEEVAEDEYEELLLPGSLKQEAPSPAKKMKIS